VRRLDLVDFGQAVLIEGSRSCKEAPSSSVTREFPRLACC